MPFRWLLPCTAIILAISVSRVFSKDLKVRKKASNTVISLNATCSPDVLEVNVVMEKPFSGILYSRGFPLECRSQGDGMKEVQLKLSPSGCGVRLNTTENAIGVWYSAVVEIQLDKQLQQISDQLRKVSCYVPDVNKERRKVVTEKPAGRVGRKMSERFPESSDAFELETVRSWLEIQGLDYPEINSQVSVGEATTLVVKTRLPGGIGSRVVDCSAHDGAGDLSQHLLDDIGCPIDELILPALEYTRPNRIRDAGLHMASAEFSAFKFPDRDTLHLTCSVLLCRGPCPDVDCDSMASNKTRRHRHIEAGHVGEVLRRLSVFNSVDVMAPGIDTDEEANNGPRSSTDFDSSHPVLSGERAVCLSPNKMALAFGILGLIFLAAVAVALYMLLRGRRKHRSKHMLLSEDTFMVQDSPILGVPAMRPAWPYVRVMR